MAAMAKAVMAATARAETAKEAMAKAETAKVGTAKVGTASRHSRLSTLRLVLRCPAGWMRGCGVLGWGWVLWGLCLRSFRGGEIGCCFGFVRLVF